VPPPEAPAPAALVSHALPGRTRIRVPDRRGDPRYFDRLRQRLGGCPEVLEVRVNAITASVLLHHRGDPAPILAFAAAASLFVLDPSPPRGVPLAVRLGAEAAAADAGLRRLAGGEVDLWTALSLGLFGLACLQAARGRLLGPASTLAWAALTAIRRAQPGGS
jgi:hypothetical protein